MDICDTYPIWLLMLNISADEYQLEQEGKQTVGGSWCDIDKP